MKIILFQPEGSKNKLKENKTQGIIPVVFLRANIPGNMRRKAGRRRCQSSEGLWNNEPSRKVDYCTKAIFFKNGRGCAVKSDFFFTAN